MRYNSLINLGSFDNYVQVRQTANIAAVQNVLTNMPFNTIDFNYGLSFNLLRVSIQEDGLYLFKANIRFTNNATGSRVLGIEVNGVLIEYTNYSPASTIAAYPASPFFVTVVPLYSGDLVCASYYNTIAGLQLLAANNSPSWFLGRLGEL